MELQCSCKVRIGEIKSCDKLLLLFAANFAVTRIRFSRFLNILTALTVPIRNFYGNFVRILM